MSDLAQQVGIGGAVAVLLVATVMKFLPAFMMALRAQKANGDGKFTYFQELQVREIVRVAVEEARKVNEATLADLRNLIAQRTEALPNIVASAIHKARESRATRETRESKDL